MSLIVSDVTKRFGGLVAVNSVSVEAEAGAVTALIGPNGAGKTTLFNMISGFGKPDSGSIAFDGKRIDSLPAWRISRLGLVRTFQTASGFSSMTVWENLMVAGLGGRPESLAAALAGPRGWRAERDAVAERAAELLEGLDMWDMRDRIGTDLSPGDAKLLDFARQVMVQPTMLLLDEPASGVDPAGIEKLVRFLRGLNKTGLTILVIDHNLSFVFSLADVVYALAAGEIISKGPPSAVSQDERVIEAYFGRANGAAQR
jgi:ABC-type branched-subunit amino acid transport system ATPase component